ncbi:hypothetical protein AVEN_103566-1 [Araneus ventricosus]|uniref:Uncharacterized protein n=1 Tax=Araneus ventricosus TaxID=182803 RepID=A0A4Y2G4T2_ARAVE|nr:hypothetical protein AVEN_103566-1 [Araneus ventricosus]
MLILRQEKEFHRELTESRANEFRCRRQACRLWKKNESSRKLMNGSPISTRREDQGPSRDYYVKSLPLGKSIEANPQTKSG